MSKHNQVGFDGCLGNFSVPVCTHNINKGVYMGERYCDCT